MPSEKIALIVAGPAIARVARTGTKKAANQTSRGRLCVVVDAVDVAGESLREATVACERKGSVAGGEQLDVRASDWERQTSVLKNLKDL